jgi:phage baseplate assembly protein V
MESWWLPVVVPKAQYDKIYWMPDIGEQVVCLMDQHDEDGAVLGSIYSSADTVPVQSADRMHLSVKDGATFDYDRVAHILSVALPSSGTVRIAANGASLTIESSGNITAVPSVGKQIQLGSGSLSGVARLGDAVEVRDDEGGILNGTIISASTTVVAD